MQLTTALWISSWVRFGSLATTLWPHGTTYRTPRHHVIVSLDTTFMNPKSYIVTAELKYHGKALEGSQYILSYPRILSPESPVPPQVRLVGAFGYLRLPLPSLFANHVVLHEHHCS
jgi:hypothetical protein